MRRLLPALLFASTPALAASFTQMELDEALDRDGWTILEATGEGRCEGPDDGWSSKDATRWLIDHDAKAVLVRRTIDNLVRLVGEDGYRPAVMRFAYQDGAEVDRVCGCMDADALTGWLDGLADGKTLAGARRAELLAKETIETGEWLEMMQMDYCASRWSDAFGTLSFLWAVIPTKAPEATDVRLTRIAHDMGVIAREHPPSKDALKSMRDALTADKDTDLDKLDDWVSLNRILGDDDMSIDWFMDNRTNYAVINAVQHQSPNIFYMLAEKGRWQDAGSLVDDLDIWLERWKLQTGGLATAAWGYAALLSADRAKDAGKLGKMILEVAPDSACEMIRKTVEIGHTDKSQKAVAKQCADEAVVASWEATL